MMKIILTFVLLLTISNCKSVEANLKTTSTNKEQSAILEWAFDPNDIKYGYLKLEEDFKSNLNENEAILIYPSENHWAKRKMGAHGSRIHTAYMEAGGITLEKPPLLVEANSKHIVPLLQKIINYGVSLFSISIAIQQFQYEGIEFEKLNSIVIENPETLFVVASHNTGAYFPAGYWSGWGEPPQWPHSVSWVGDINFAVNDYMRERWQAVRRPRNTVNISRVRDYKDANTDPRCENKRIFSPAGAWNPNIVDAFCEDCVDVSAGTAIFSGLLRAFQKRNEISDIIDAKDKFLNKLELACLVHPKAEIGYTDSNDEILPAGIDIIKVFNKKSGS